MREFMLEVDRLEANYYCNYETLYPLYDISFNLYEREIVVLYSEYDVFRRGLIYSIMGLVNKYFGRIVSGNINFKGKNILKLSEKEMMEIRGNKISAIHNVSKEALNPRFKVGYQIKESLLIHKTSKNQDKIVIKVLGKLGIENIEKVYESYPYELDNLTISKVHLAIGLVNEPEVLIINNITENLKETEKREIFKIFKQLKEESNISILYMTDDFNFIDELADRVIVSDKGILLEDCLIEDFLNKPLHPYTRDLIKNTVDTGKWDIKRKSYSCIYYKKCNIRKDGCLEYLPEYIFLNNNHNVRCIFYL